MTRRTIVIILSAVVLALFVAFIWFTFFRGTPQGTTNNGTFGTGQTRNGGSGTNGNTSGNVPSTVLNNGGSQGTAGANQPSGSGSGTSGSVVGSVGGSGGVSSVPGVDWLGNNGTPNSGVTTNFVPKAANQLNNGNAGGTPGILGTNLPGQSGNGNDLGLAGLFGAGAGCALYAAFQGAGEAKAGAEGAASIGGGFVLVYDWRANSKQSSTQFKDIGDCLTRTIGKAIVQQITNSIVNWINSGFNGKPSFVTNFQQFFSNVGDQAAGEFIRGTGLSFLCSPFQNQIRIAVAQSYARRNAQSCSLSGIVKNINSFMGGNFGAGGWAGLLSFTTVPTNNPFGAFSYAQIGLQTAQQNAINEANRNVSTGGFISIKKCDNVPGAGSSVSTGSLTNCKVTTPGSVIEGALKKTVVDVPYDSLNLAKSFDEIINALITQLTTRTLYQGLSNLSGSQGYAANYLTPAEQAAQTTAQGLLTDMQSRMSIAQQYGSVWVGGVNDIQQTQQRLHTLQDCYTSHGKQDQASTTQSIIAAYDGQIDRYNDKITLANDAIAKLQDFQTQVVSVLTPSDVAAVQGAYQAALAGGAFPSDADVTTAQQDRASLQNLLDERNAATQDALTQCNAL